MNLVITISRRFGTGASLIAQELSEKLGVPVYDKAYIEHELDGDSYATEAEVIKELAEHPCIILGRCASEILKDQPNVFNVYVCADKEDRIERIMKKESLPHDEAKEMLEKNDAERADYNAVDFTTHDIRQEPLKIFTVGVRSSMTIIHIFRDAFKLVNVASVKIVQ